MFRRASDEYSKAKHSNTTEKHHIDKWAFTVPFVCGATNLGEALRRISEGACMIRSKGEAGTGNVIQAVRHLRTILGDIKKIGQSDSAELFDWAKRLQAPIGLVQEIAETGKDLSLKSCVISFAGFLECVGFLIFFPMLTKV